MTDGGFGLGGGFDIGGKDIEVLALDDLTGCDAVLLVVAQLFLTTTVGLVDGLLHALGNLVGIHDDQSVDVACRTTCCLCE